MSGLIHKFISHCRPMAIASQKKDPTDELCQLGYCSGVLWKMHDQKILTDKQAIAIQKWMFTTKDDFLGIVQ